MQNYSTPNYLHEIGNQPPRSSGSNNKFVYFKQNFVPNAHIASSKVLVNPHFNKKVFVNPNYIPNSPATFSGNIHVNPNVAFNLPRENNKIHINPKILQKVPCSQDHKNVPPKTNTVEPKQNVLMYSSKTKLIRKPVKEQTIQESKRIRRASIYTKFKAVKSSLLNRSPEIKATNRLVFNSKYKLKRESTNKLVKSSSPVKLTTRFKLDNRKKSLLSISHKNTKYVFVNRFLSITDIAKTLPLRTNRSLLNISGIMYKNSPNSLQRVIKMERRKLLLSNQNKPLSKTRFKIVRVSEAKCRSSDKKNLKNNSRFSTKKLKMSQQKLKKCNIPCPYYRKFGKCKGKDLGKCSRKHDPDQIALCTKFLQGACIDPKCSLSHNVSAEKMPTCKFYLEGSCSKDSCPYLHVRISPKADICKDFIEGFCKKASECDKRHQFLCPDFEKKGTCLKPRCPYPHGRMVRKYSDYNKHKFAKKSSKNIKNSITNKINENSVPCNKIEEIVEPEVNPAIRYYSDKKIETQNSVKNESNNEVDSNQKINLRIRPKLGELPSFISLEDC